MKVMIPFDAVEFRVEEVQQSGVPGIVQVVVGIELWHEGTVTMVLPKRYVVPEESVTLAKIVGQVEAEIS